MNFHSACLKDWTMILCGYRLYIMTISSCLAEHGRSRGFSAELMALVSENRSPARGKIAVYLVPLGLQVAQIQMNVVWFLLPRKYQYVSWMNTWIMTIGTKPCGSCGVSVQLAIWAHGTGMARRFASLPEQKSLTPMTIIITTSSPQPLPLLPPPSSSSSSHQPSSSIAHTCHNSVFPLHSRLLSNHGPSQVLQGNIGPCSWNSQRSELGSTIVQRVNLMKAWWINELLIHGSSLKKRSNMHGRLMEIDFKSRRMFLLFRWSFSQVASFPWAPPQQITPSGLETKMCRGRQKCHHCHRLVSNRPRPIWRTSGSK